MKLIITADDFGAAPEVNEAVERAYRNLKAGIVEGRYRKSLG